MYLAPLRTRAAPSSAALRAAHAASARPRAVAAERERARATWSAQTACTASGLERRPHHRQQGHQRPARPPSACQTCPRTARGAGSARKSVSARAGIGWSRNQLWDTVKKSRLPGPPCSVQGARSPPARRHNGCRRPSQPGAVLSAAAQARAVLPRGHEKGTLDWSPRAAQGNGEALTCSAKLAGPTERTRKVAHRSSPSAPAGWMRRRCTRRRRSNEAFSRKGVTSPDLQGECGHVSRSRAGCAPRSRLTAATSARFDRRAGRRRPLRAPRAEESSERLGHAARTQRTPEVRPRTTCTVHLALFGGPAWRMASSAASPPLSRPLAADRELGAANRDNWKDSPSRALADGPQHPRLNHSPARVRELSAHFAPFQCKRAV